MEKHPNHKIPTYPTLERGNAFHLPQGHSSPSGPDIPAWAQNIAHAHIPCIGISRFPPGGGHQETAKNQRATFFLLLQIRCKMVLLREYSSHLHFHLLYSYLQSKTGVFFAGSI